MRLTQYEDERCIQPYFDRFMHTDKLVVTMWFSEDDR